MMVVLRTVIVVLVMCAFPENVSDVRHAAIIPDVIAPLVLMALAEQLIPHVVVMVCIVMVVQVVIVALLMVCVLVLLMQNVKKVMVLISLALRIRVPQQSIVEL